eukprot:309230-Prorocentrum_minimum.AAC.4
MHALALFHRTVTISWMLRSWVLHRVSLPGTKRLPLPVAAAAAGGAAAAALRRLQRGGSGLGRCGRDAATAAAQADAVVAAAVAAATAAMVVARAAGFVAAAAAKEVRGANIHGCAHNVHGRRALLRRLRERHAPACMYTDQPARRYISRSVYHSVGCKAVLFLEAWRICCREPGLAHPDLGTHRVGDVHPLGGDALLVLRGGASAGARGDQPLPRRPAFPAALRAALRLLQPITRGRVVGTVKIPRRGCVEYLLPRSRGGAILEPGPYLLALAARHERRGCGGCGGGQAVGPRLGPAGPLRTRPPLGGAALFVRPPPLRLRQTPEDPGDKPGPKRGYQRSCVEPRWSDADHLWPRHTVLLTL